MATCYSCGTEFPDSFAVYRSTACPSCGKDVKVCMNCKFYEPGVHWDCRESVNELVVDKERSNFCEFFVLSPEARTPRSGASAKKARSDFDQLFGDG